MQRSQIIPFHSYENAIKQLCNDIRSYIKTLEDNIEQEKKSLFIISQDDIKLWKAKIAVLTVALSCLWGDKKLGDLEIATSQCALWDKGIKSHQTKTYVEKVKNLLTPNNLAPSFFLSCITNHFNLVFRGVADPDLQCYVLTSCLNPMDTIHFAMTDKTNWQFFLQKTSVIYLPRLLDHVALGDYEAAEKLYTKYPALLTKKGSPSYHLKLDLKRYQYTNLTAFQIALRNGEYQEAEKIGKHLLLEERQKQFNEVFPKGEIVSSGCQLETAKLLLNDVHNALIKDILINKDNLDLMTNETRIALDALYNAINPEKMKCQTGLVFDVQIYLEAMKLYYEKLCEENNVFGNNRHTLKFWSVRVEESIASCLPTVYLRAHCRGICNVVNNSVVNWDILSGKACVLSDGSSYFKRNSNDLPGRHFFVSFQGEPDNSYRSPWMPLYLFRTYVREQQKQEQRLCSTISMPTHRLL